MDIGGNELEPVDEEEVRGAALKMVREQEVRAFAVSGYGGSVNPAHELAVKRSIVAATGCDVCCGHELSHLLNFRLRANTAVLNAGIIPLLERFLDDVRESLATLGITARIMVVKGDGSLMGDGFARRHPVETLLSGPAASLAGARYLTDCPSATIVDVGGTTSDIGKLAEGSVDVCSSGAIVGGWRTHVRAVDMRTLGLGGDSEIRVEKRELMVGPRRIAPICWLAAQYDCDGPLSYLEANADDYATDTRTAQLFMKTSRAPVFTLSDQEERVLEALAPGPLSLGQLVEATDAGHPLLLRLKRLEEDCVIQRCGLTPTDLLHSEERISLWNRAAALRFARFVSSLAGYELSDFSQAVFTCVTQKLVFELVRKQLSLDPAEETAEESKTEKAMFRAMMEGGNEDFVLSAGLKRPLVGLGAAAEFFLREPARLLSAELLIPENADVANAVGAITSMVHVSCRGSVVPSSDGSYFLSGVEGNLKFSDFDSAHSALVLRLEQDVRELAKAAGTNAREVGLSVNDRISATADGAEPFLERRVTADIVGAPM